MSAAPRTITIVITAGIALLAVSSRPAHAGQDAAKGKGVYTAQKCSMCHAAEGKGNKTNPLDGVGTKLTADDLRTWIVTPKEAAAKAKSTKKPPMPDKYGKLPAADIDALVAYMQSLK